MIELTCPACENRLAIEESQLGGFVLCPHCNVQLDLTDDEPPAPQAQPQQTSSKKRVVLKKNTGSTGGPVIHTQGSGAPYQPAPPPSGPIPVKITGVSMGFGEDGRLSNKMGHRVYPRNDHVYRSSLVSSMRLCSEPYSCLPVKSTSVPRRRTDDESQ